jgi:hypothetical protein
MLYKVAAVVLLLTVAGCGGVPFSVLTTDAIDDSGAGVDQVVGSGSSSGSQAMPDGSDVQETSTPPMPEGGGHTEAGPAVIDAAGDKEAAADGSQDSPALGPDGCTLVVHSNGLGGTWTDCVPLGTYDHDQAVRACLSDGAIVCDVGGSSTSNGPYYVICAVGLTDYPCWIYSGLGTGQVTDGTGSRPATPNDPHWY